MVARLTRSLSVAIALTVACQGVPATSSGSGPSLTPGPATAPVAQGIGELTYVVAAQQGLLTFDREGRALGRLAELPPQTFASFPALHPSGREMAFVLTTIVPSAAGFGADIYTIKVDGTGLRKLVAHEQENTFYSGPAYDPTGRFLYFQRRASALREGTVVNDDSIERLDLVTGERRRVLADGTDPTISPDGHTLVYVHLVRGQLDTLWIAGVDGTDPHPLFKVKDRFYYLQTPRFAPTGCQIVFSGAGRTARSGSAGGRSAHLGVPSELYLAPCDGSSITTIGETYDDVAPVWSADGTRVAYALGGAITHLVVATREVRKLAQGTSFAYGDLVWVRNG